MEGRDRLGIAHALKEMARLLDLAREDTFKARAYARGAAVLEGIDDVTFERLVAEDRLTALSGIGVGLAARIIELHRTGRAEALDTLRAQLPPGASELGRLGLPLAKIVAIHQALGVETLADLRAAAEAGRVRNVKGIGPKTEARILEAIRRLEAPGPAPTGTRALLAQALEAAEPVLAHLRRAPGVTAAEIAGALRRGLEMVDGIEVVVASTTPAAARAHALALPGVLSVSESGPAAYRAVLDNGLPLEVRVGLPDHHATTLLHTTGSSAHLTHLARLAEGRGLHLTRGGLTRSPSGPPLAARDEEDLYGYLGLPFIPPELREDEGEIEAALEGRLPDDLVEEGDIRGLVHCHTVYSDGRHTVAEMAAAADALGMAYLTVTDHSPTASYAGGLSVDRLRAQWDEIARVQESVAVRLLRGTECDILADGALDYPDAILEQLDVIIASVHQRHRLGREEMTRRLTRAMRHPCFKIWGHALGRLIPSRPPIDVDVEQVLDVAAASRVAIEINGDPRRLDLAPRWLRAARERKLSFVISTDAHAVSELGNLGYGVTMARRGWVRGVEVLNTLDAAGFARAVAPAGTR
jgi:DNA polymerase (family 10)